VAAALLTTVARRPLLAAVSLLVKGGVNLNCTAGPAASRATAVSVWLPLVAVVVSHVIP
jgi:hypothetical protein